MSTRHYRYYNSPAGVGVTVITRVEGEHARIDWKGKHQNPRPWIRTADLYQTPEQAHGKPYARFQEAKPWPGD